MSAHLRRILLAKCVVDARNKTYMRKKKQVCKETDWKPRFGKTEITNNIIDKLAYDTSYHPVVNYSYYYICIFAKNFISNNTEKQNFNSTCFFD